MRFHQSLPFNIPKKSTTPTKAVKKAVKKVLTEAADPTFPPHLVSLRKGDYVVLSIPVQKKDGTAGHPHTEVMRVRKVHESSVMGSTVLGAHKGSKDIECKLTEIVCNLGAKPAPIYVAGVNFGELFTTFTSEHPKFGRLNWSFEPDEKMLAKVNAGYDKIQTWLKANGLAELYQIPMVQEITHIKSKHAGMVHASKDLTKAPSIVRFQPTHPYIVELASYTYVVAHEFAHIIDFHLLDKSPKTRAKWLSLFMGTVNPESVDPALADSLLERLLAAPTFRDFRSSVDEEERPAMNTILRLIQRTQNVSAREISLLLESGTIKDIKKRWPTPEQCLDPKLTPLVSEYGTKNVRELFAESLAYRVVGKKLPKVVDELLDVSLQRAVRRLPSLLEDLRNGTMSTSDD